MFQAPPFAPAPPSVFNYSCEHCWCLEVTEGDPLPSPILSFYPKTFHGEGPHRRCCKCSDVMAEVFIDVIKAHAST
jgi:hypothetical protein